MKRSQDLYPDAEDVLLRELGKSVDPDKERFQKNLLNRVVKDGVFPSYEQNIEWPEKKSRMYRYAYAAVFLAIFTVLVSYWYNHSPNPIASIVVALGDLTTSADTNSSYSLCAGDTVQSHTDSQASLLLSDKSLIRLDEESSIRVLEPRKIELLEGRLLANVSKKSTRERFEINTNDISIVVLGTSFEVDTQKDRTAVTVYHGSVQVNWANEIKILKKGESLSISPQENISRTSTTTEEKPIWIKNLRSAELTNPILQAMQRHFPSRSYNAPKKQ